MQQELQPNFDIPSLSISNDSNSKNDKKLEINIDESEFDSLLSNDNVNNQEPNFENRLINLYQIGSKLFAFLQEKIKANDHLSEAKKEEMIKKLNEHQLLNEFSNT